MKNRIAVMTIRAALIMGVGYVVDEALIRLYARDKRLMKIARKQWVKE